jgi:UPF0755 protein
VRALIRTTFVLALAAAAALVAWRRDTLAPRAPRTPPLVLDVPPGTSAEAVARKLAELGFVRHPLLFQALVWQRGAGNRLRAGHYPLETPLSPLGLLELLEKGQAERNHVTIPEGRSLTDIAALVGAQDVDPAAFLAAARDPAAIRDLDPKAEDLEGYLFPDTYDVPRSADAPVVLVRRMVQRFREVAAPLLPRLADAGLGLREAVTLASIVELETARAAERPRIAAVFLNRLRVGMPLQTDPTVIYALKQAGPYDGNIRKKDLALDSPYNTYRYAGLPPGPIGSPGLAALLAVLEPAPVKDLYFVSRNDGTHEFSETLRDHERAVDRYQRFGRRTPTAPAAGRAPGPGR